MTDKIQFLQSGLVPAIAGIAADRQPNWGKMNLQQMTEHMAREGFACASGKSPQQLVTPEEHVPKMQAFLMSDKQFRENTVNVLMAADPPPVIHPDMPAALSALQQEIDDFFEVFEQEPDKKLMNPFFGELNKEMWIQLLFKHAQHHLKQFGVVL